MEVDGDAHGGPLSPEAQNFLDALNVAEFVDLTLLVDRPYRLKTLHRMVRRRHNAEARFFTHAGPADVVVAVMYCATIFALRCVRYLVFGVRIVRALRRNVRTGKCRSHLMANMMQRIVGARGVDGLGGLHPVEP